MHLSFLSIHGEDCNCTEEIWKDALIDEGSEGGSDNDDNDEDISKSQTQQYTALSLGDTLFLSSSRSLTLAIHTPILGGGNLIIAAD